MSPEPLAAAPGLYLHIPFCSAICPYCDFAVTTGGTALRASFVDALCREVEIASRRWSGPRGFDTVYFGGGTPSTLSPDQLARILDTCRAHLGISPGAWLSLEANPEDVSPARLRAWRDLGADTVSLGVQSFDAAELRFLGRRHDPGTAIRAVERSLEAGLPIVSVDLIYGLPDRPPDAWLRSLEQALALAPQHLSCYQLSMPEGTPFGRRREAGKLAELDESSQSELFVLTHDRLRAAGFAPYEVSNFARAERWQSRHNRKYWAHVPYLGLGPGAHSFDGARRWWNERRSRRYIERLAAGQPAVAGEEPLGPRELLQEAVMLGLRQVTGIDLRALRDRFDTDLEASNCDRIAELVARGLAVREDGTLRLTPRGLAVADAITASLEV